MVVGKANHWVKRTSQLYMLGATWILSCIMSLLTYHVVLLLVCNKYVHQMYTSLPFLEELLYATPRYEFSLFPCNVSFKRLVFKTHTEASVLMIQKIRDIRLIEGY